MKFTCIYVDMDIYVVWIYGREYDVRGGRNYEQLNDDEIYFLN